MREVTGIKKTDGGKGGGDCVHAGDGLAPIGDVAGRSGVLLAECPIDTSPPDTQSFADLRCANPSRFKLSNGVGPNGSWPPLVNTRRDEISMWLGD